MDRAAPSEPIGGPAGARLEPLAWDSHFFGHPVARLSEVGPDDDDLGRALERARRSGVRLVYWPADRDREAPAGLIREYQGRLVDRKATFRCPGLAGMVLDRPASGCPSVVGEYPRGEPSPPLVALALASGAFSRFRVDPRIPTARFEALYTEWIRRSARGESGGTVLVASATGQGMADPAGMVTVGVRQGLGEIGLFAVRESDRGRGVGTSLMTAAHRWMIAQGAAQSTVVTQLDNGPACRIYGRSGYHLDDLRNFYHFWPSPTAPGRP